MLYLGSNGARGRDRTTDTAIFSRMLYQLSYPGVSREARPDASGRFIERLCPNVQRWGPFFEPIPDHPVK